MKMPADYIFRIDELCREFNDVVGKKCANLGEMARIGLRVPPGFSLSIEAYKRFMSETGAAQAIKAYLDSLDHGLETIDQFNEASTALRRIVETREMPRDMKEQILAYYREICQKCNTEKVAVSTRSAGAASHPGQFETHLNVLGEDDLIQKVIRVWSSTFNARSLSARSRVGLPLESDPIGVAVIKMVRPTGVWEKVSSAARPCRTCISWTRRAWKLSRGNWAQRNDALLFRRWALLKWRHPLTGAMLFV
jgi:pyruvate,water dikinase